MMRIKHLLSVLGFIICLISCNASTDDYQSLYYKQQGFESDQAYGLSGIANCSRYYTNGQFSVLEVFCAKQEDGLYFSNENNLSVFGWYDKPFNEWAVSEGCNQIKECYYDLIVDDSGNIKEFIYHFYINLSAGFYRVKAIDNHLVVVDQQIVDYP